MSDVPLSWFTLSELPVDCLSRVFSLLPFEDRLLRIALVCKSFHNITRSSHLLWKDVVLSLASIRRSQPAATRTAWRPVKSLLIRWFQMHGPHIQSLHVVDSIRPLSDDDMPCCLLPVLPNLRSLRLQRCVATSIPLIPMLRHLEELHVTLTPCADVTYNGSVRLDWLSSMQTLTALSLETPSTCSETAPQGIETLTQLKQLSLYNTTDGVVQQVLQLTQLSALALHRFRGVNIPAALSKCTFLQKLVISLHSVPMSVEANMQGLSGLKNLRSLQLLTSRPARVDISSLMLVLASLPALRHVDVAFCNCAFKGPAKAAPAVVMSALHQQMAYLQGVTLIQTPPRTALMPPGCYCGYSDIPAPRLPGSVGGYAPAAGVMYCPTALVYAPGMLPGVSATGPVFVNGTVAYTNPFPSQVPWASQPVQVVPQRCQGCRT